MNTRSKPISKELARSRKIVLATPCWADIGRIREIYVEAERRRRAGFDVVVDHVVPVNHRYVTGLHCEYNLAIISAPKNAHKSNHYWPDMPNENEDLFGIPEVEQYELF